MRIVSIIPARSGSKRVLNKNIKSIGSFPLLSYSIIASKLSPLIDETIVSTDSMGIAYVGLYYGANIPFLRPEHLASDTATDYDVVLHFMEKYYAFYKEYPKYIVHLRPTTPFRDPDLITKAIMSIKHGATSLRSVEPLVEAPEKNFRIKDDYLVGLFPENRIKDYHNLPNQSFEPAYAANGYVDILIPEHILATKTLHGDRIQAFITPPTVEIDTQDDFDYADYILTTKGNGIYEFLKKREFYYFYTH